MRPPSLAKNSNFNVFKESLETVKDIHFRKFIAKLL